MTTDANRENGWVRPMGAVPAAAVNLETIRQERAQAVRADNSGVAGFRHAQPCQHCRATTYQADGTPLHDSDAHNCKCVERCQWPACPSDVVRDDPVNYSPGFGRPPVPTFRKEAAA